MKKSILGLLFALATTVALVTGCGGGSTAPSAPPADATIPFPGNACIVTDKVLETAEGSEISFFYNYEGKKYEVNVINDAAEGEFNKAPEKYMEKLKKMLAEEAGAAPAPAAQ